MSPVSKSVCFFVFMFVGTYTISLRDFYTEVFMASTCTICGCSIERLKIEVVFGITTTKHCPYSITEHIPS
jgi:hypothetical protein